MSARFVPLLFAVGCTAGPAPETVLADVRVVSLDAGTPEVAPGDVVDLSALVADPKGEGAEVAVWSCTSFAPPGAPPSCAEAEIGWAVGTPEATLVRGAPTDERLQVRLPTSPALAGLLSGEVPALPVGVWVVACRPGLCPLLDDLDEAGETGVIDEGLAADLADPTRWLADLPFDGVSVARRTIVVSNRPAAERNTNPVLTVDPPAAVSIDAPVDVVVEASDAESEEVTVAPYATAGGFGTIIDMIAASEPSPLSLYAPADGDSVQIYVTATDGEGGSASWRGTVPVE